MSADIHTCSYQCDRPACIREQRDELVAKLDAVTKDALALQGRAQRAESLLVHCRNDMLDVLASGRPTGSTDELADEIAALTDQGRAGEG